ncbi:uncharacterized protein LOC117896690 [Drosophila subobscura]|uniref:uncharacterized protein LOC117896690 n=1 Tax=Drosophila subobscura TaxID=7241 RepID=UPI00155B06B9|nr:uncharacterized protein LOC117896690 [Drosophila subobscura]
MYKSIFPVQPFNDRASKMMHTMMVKASQDLPPFIYGDHRDSLNMMTYRRNMKQELEDYCSPTWIRYRAKKNKMMPLLIDVMQSCIEFTHLSLMMRPVSLSEMASLESNMAAFRKHISMTPLYEKEQQQQRQRKIKACIFMGLTIAVTVGLLAYIFMSFK